MRGVTTHKNARETVPVFASVEEEAAFWDTHSPLDYPEYWTEVTDSRADDLPRHILAVPLDAQSIEKLAAIAHTKGLGPSTLARMWLLERLMPGER